VDDARFLVEAICADPGEVDPLAMVARIRSGADAGLDDGAYERSMDDVETLLQADEPVDAARVADRLGRVTDRLGNDSRAFTSVPTAIYAGLAHADSFEDAVPYAIAIGGDTDAIDGRRRRRRAARRRRPTVGSRPSRPASEDAITARTRSRRRARAAGGFAGELAWSGRSERKRNAEG
jgi:hypothetical protein